ncbi:MAG: GDSL-type esterase/lipase family protein, partial [Cyanobacteria bacterium P01_A01_bin.80]
NSYSDNTNGNLGGAYRSDNVDIQNTSDVGGGYNVGWIQSGESLTYNFNLAESGTYKLVSRVASAEGGDHSFQVSLGGQQTQLNLGNTGDWQSWIDVESTQNFTLNAGSNTLEVDMLGNNFNINYFDLVKVESDSGNTNTPNSTPQVQQVNLDLGNIFEAGTGTGNQTYNGSNAIDTVRYADVNSGFGIEGNLETGVVKYKSAPASNDTITIMPFGDSITDGYMASDTAGYRDDLWNTLTSEGYNIDMVGSKSEGAGDFDKDHSGYSGYRIDEIANLADGLINTYDPDVVFLMIGTNDILQDYNLDTAPDRLSSLIDTITDASPDTEVFVASIPPDKNSARQERVVDYNAQIPGIVEEKQNQGKKVTYVDMSSQLDTGDLEDDVHPTPEGNQKIADVWSDAFRNHYGQPNTSSDISPDNLNNIDNLIGTTYDDTLTGNAGNNTIIGGNGYDYLAGGSGSDKFLIASGQETDTIIDFQVGEDLIVLDGLSYGQLTIASGSSYGYNSNDTVIINNNNNSEQLAILTGVQSNTVNANSFGIV